MTTATAPTKDALVQLAELEIAEREADEKASAISRELGTKRRRLAGHRDTRGAIDELRRLHDREPDQWDEDGKPRKNTAAAKLTAEVERLTAEIAQLDPQYEQARRLVAHAKEAREVFTAGELPAIIDALIPEAAEIRDEANASAAAHAEVLRRYVGFNHRVQGLLGTRMDLRKRQIRTPGLDAAAENMRIAEKTDLPLPIPELPA